MYLPVWECLSVKVTSHCTATVEASCRTKTARDFKEGKTADSLNPQCLPSSDKQARDDQFSKMMAYIWVHGLQNSILGCAHYFVVHIIPVSTCFVPTLPTLLIWSKLVTDLRSSVAQRRNESDSKCRKIFWVLSCENTLCQLIAAHWDSTFTYCVTTLFKAKACNFVSLWIFTPHQFYIGYSNRADNSLFLLYTKHTEPDHKWCSDTDNVNIQRHPDDAKLPGSPWFQ